jgi:hypothetical protein
MRILVLLLLAFPCVQAAAQTTPLFTSEQNGGAAQQVQSASPQLVTFAGSEANLQALVNGIGLGQTVTLVTPGADGVLQIVTFTPPSALGSDVSRALEQARTNLIARGISQPTAQQVATALMGGTLATAAGPVQLSGVLTGAIAANAFQVRNEIAGNLVGGATPFGGSAANLQALSTGLRQGTAITLTAPVNGVSQTVTFTPPGGPMSQTEANQILALASQLLAAQGIVNPTPAQIQAAIVGGTVAVPGGSVALQGVLQGRVRNTSDSPSGAISATPVTGSSPSVSSPVIGSPSTGSPVVTSTPGLFNPPASSGAGGTTPPPRFGAAR